MRRNGVFNNTNNNLKAGVCVPIAAGALNTTPQIVTAQIVTPQIATPTTGTVLSNASAPNFTNIMSDSVSSNDLAIGVTVGIGLVTVACLYYVWSNRDYFIKHPLTEQENPTKEAAQNPIQEASQIPSQGASQNPTQEAQQNSNQEYPQDTPLEEGNLNRDEEEGNPNRDEDSNGEDDEEDIEMYPWEDDMDNLEELRDRREQVQSALQDVIDQLPETMHDIEVPPLLRIIPPYTERFFSWAREATLVDWQDSVHQRFSDLASYSQQLYYWVERYFGVNILEYRAPGCLPFRQALLRLLSEVDSFYDTLIQPALKFLDWLVDHDGVLLESMGSFARFISMGSPVSNLQNLWAIVYKLVEKLHPHFTNGAIDQIVYNPRGIPAEILLDNMDNILYFAQLFREFPWIF